MRLISWASLPCQCVLFFCMHVLTFPDGFPDFLLDQSVHG
jgi:hypothetical protein